MRFTVCAWGSSVLACFEFDFGNKNREKMKMEWLDGRMAGRKDLEMHLPL